MPVLLLEWPTLHLETEAMGFRSRLGFMRPEILGFGESEIMMFWENWMKDELVQASDVGGTILGLRE